MTLFKSLEIATLNRRVSILCAEIDALRSDVDALELLGVRPATQRAPFLGTRRSPENVATHLVSTPTGVRRMYDIETMARSLGSSVHAIVCSPLPWSAGSAQATIKKSALSRGPKSGSQSVKSWEDSQ
jgi:hypothetical protein